MAEGNHTTRWIIALCITAVLAIAGWTVTFTQSLKARTYEAVVQEAVTLKGIVTAHTTQIAVLDTKYATFQESLNRIEELLVRHMGE